MPRALRAACPCAKHSFQPCFRQFGDLSSCQVLCLRLLRGQDSSSLLSHCALRGQDRRNARPVPERLRASPRRLPEANPLPHSLLLRTYYFKAGWPLTLAESSTGPTVSSPTQHQAPPLHLQANEELRVLRGLTLQREPPQHLGVRRRCCPRGFTSQCHPTTVRTEPYLKFKGGIGVLGRELSGQMACCASMKPQFGLPAPT